MANYHLTTPIYYVNAAPHIGHAYTTIAADVIFRENGAVNAFTGQVVEDKVQFTTGTDENSLKNVEAAEKVGKPIQQYVDELSAVWEDTWGKLGISGFSFIRTSSESHKKAVEKFWHQVAARGDIYKDKYVGLYCKGCEAYTNETELVEGKCPHHLTAPEQLEEENYFFRASRYKAAILSYIEENPEFISPASRRNETISFIKNNFRDISISRKNLEWGIPVPGDPEQVIYVWFDALINYISAVGYGSDDFQFESQWPADLHLVGKDIIKFHCALWPAMLMSASIPLPKKIFAHGFFTIDGQKISKSLGNAIDPLKIAERYGSDALRYYLLAKIPFGSDGDFCFRELEATYNSDLANVLGNLVSRLTNMVDKYLDGKIAQSPMCINFEQGQFSHQIHQLFTDLQFKEGLELIWQRLRQANKTIEDTKPWALYKEEKTSQLTNILTNLVVEVSFLARCFSSVMPITAKKILAATWVDQIVKAEPLFPRLEG